MRRHRGWPAAPIAAVLISMLVPVNAQAHNKPTGRILYLEFAGPAIGTGALKSVRPSGRGTQDFGRALTWFSAPDYAPDGARISYADGFDIRVMNSDGTDDHWVGSGPFGPGFPRWSPDGELIAFESGGDIYAVQPDGPPGLVTLAASAENELFPTWAPNSSRIAASTLTEVRIYATRNARFQKAIALPGVYRIDWSPIAGVIAAEAGGDLWLINVASGDVRRLTDTPDLLETSPIWSPNGRLLAYGRGAIDPAQPDVSIDPEIWLMDRGGGHQRSTGVSGVPSSWRTAP